MSLRFRFKKTIWVDELRSRSRICLMICLDLYGRDIDGRESGGEEREKTIEKIKYKATVTLYIYTVTVTLYFIFSIVSSLSSPPDSLPSLSLPYKSSNLEKSSNKSWSRF